MLATSDIFLLAPDFANMVIAIHNTLTPIAGYVCAVGLIFLAIQGMRERHIHGVMESMVRIFVIALLVGGIDKVGDWIGDAVTAVKDETHVTGSPMQAYVNAIYQKFGVDLSKNFGDVTPGGLSSPLPDMSQATVSTYGALDDPNLDPNSAKGIGAGPYGEPG